MMDTGAAYFSLDEVRKAFAGKPVLNGVTCDFHKGKTTVVLGGSGAGKSVLLKHLNGLIRPDSGSVKMEGKEISDLGERELLVLRRSIGILFQDGALFDSMSVEENVAFPLVEEGNRDTGAVSDRVARALDLVGLSGDGEKMPGNLSGGMRKRVSLARAMIARPDCLLCDEPTAGLDPVLSDAISCQIRDLSRENEMTTVVVTHDLGAMNLVADRVLFLEKGRILFDGELENLYTADDPVIRGFLSATGGRG